MGHELGIYYSLHHHNSPQEDSMKGEWELQEDLGESEGKVESGRDGVSYIGKSVVLS